MSRGRPGSHVSVYRPGGRAGEAGVQRAIPTTIVSFDIGQTLVELDLDFLAARLGTRGLEVAPSALAAASPAAWAHFDALVDAGTGHPWRELMGALLAGAGVAEVGPHVEWLWEQQPTVNLFRRPIAPMVAIARELQARGVPMVVVSNSEGGLADLLAEIGLADLFATILDSRRVGIEKPDPRIFHLAAPPGADAIHIGDSWAADIAGALGAGWRAIWYGRRARPVEDARVGVAPDAAAVRARLVEWGVLGAGRSG